LIVNKKNQIACIRNGILIANRIKEPKRRQAGESMTIELEQKIQRRKPGKDTPVIIFVACYE
jgi:hypothetical protein